MEEISRVENSISGSHVKATVYIAPGFVAQAYLSIHLYIGETVPSTTQKFIQLQFLNFQPVHDGVYHCFASASDTDEELSSDLYLYGSGEDCMCA